MKKIILGLVAIVIIAGAFLMLNLDHAVKTLIEKQGSRALGVAVTLRDFDVSLSDQSAKIDGIAIANPKGFTAKNILATEAIAVKLGAVSKQLVAIEDVTVDGLQVTYELSSKGGTNFDALKAKLAKTEAKTQEKAEKGTKTRGPKIILTRLKITNATLISSLAGQEAPIQLPEIILTNLGTANSPATIAQISTQILQKILAVSSQAVIKNGLNQAEGLVKKGLQDQIKKQGLGGLLGN
jgi:hypothetical protein